MSTSSTFVVKACFQNEIRRFTLSEAKYDSLRNHLCGAYQLQHIRVQYTDDDGDLVTLSSDTELSEAFRITASGPLKVKVISTSPSEPISDVAVANIEAEVVNVQNETEAPAHAEVDAEVKEVDVEDFTEPEVHTQDEVETPEVEAETPNVEVELKPASSGNPVRMLQLALREQGLRVGPIDGHYGRMTTCAVEAFQRQIESPVVDGVAGPWTLKALKLDSSPLHGASRGPAVRGLQLQLTRKGYFVGFPDGNYGRRTAEGVRQFQASRSLDVTGIANATTISALGPHDLPDSIVTSASDLLVSLTQLFTDPSIQTELVTAIKAGQNQLAHVLRNKGKPGEAGTDTVLEAFLASSTALAAHPAVLRLKVTVNVLLTHALSVMPAGLGDMVASLPFDNIDFENTVLPHLNGLVSILSPLLEKLKSGTGMQMPMMPMMGMLGPLFAGARAGAPERACSMGPFQVPDGLLEMLGAGSRCQLPGGLMGMLGPMFGQSQPRQSEEPMQTNSCRGQPVGDAVHHGIVCDGCNVSPITGPRFKCTVCPDYDLCQKCEEKDSHPRAHSLMKIRTPLPAKVVHHGVECDGCGVTPISGPRYKCSVCPDYDLCESCEEKQVHSATGHPLIKMRLPKSRCAAGGRGRWGCGGRGAMRRMMSAASSMSNSMSEQEVKDLQSALKRHSIPVGPVDGRFGWRTAKSLAMFQQGAGLEIGALNPATCSALGLASSSSPPPSPPPSAPQEPSPSTEPEIKGTEKLNPVNAEPEHVHAGLLPTLHELGFVEDEVSLKILAAVNGDIPSAVATLINGPPYWCL